jgi:hypothetical protein
MFFTNLPRNFKLFIKILSDLFIRVSAIVALALTITFALNQLLPVSVAKPKGSHSVPATVVPTAVPAIVPNETKQGPESQSQKYADGSLEDLLRMITGPDPAPPQGDPEVLTLMAPLGFGDFGEWEMFNNRILGATAKKIVIEIQGYGGVGDIGIKAEYVLHKARAQGKEIIMHVVGPAYSMSAFYTCAADKVVIFPGASLMFHQGKSEVSFFGLSYLTSSSEISQNAVQDQLFNQCIQAKMMDPMDVEALKAGMAVYLVNDNGQIVKKIDVDPVEAGIRPLLVQILAIIILALGFQRWYTGIIRLKRGDKK